MSESTSDRRRIAILAHDRFPDGAKTATGVLRYGDDEVVAVLDRATAGDRVADYLTDVPDAPIVAETTDVPGDVDALLIGIAPIGGGFDPSWRDDVRVALERGCDVVSGLHYFLADDEEFASLADEYGGELVDVRRPHPNITVSRGVADEVDAEVVLTVGTDGSVGKMTTTLELVEAARERGIDAAFVPTGQTGIMIAGWGNPIDHVVSDYVAGAVEEMILEKGGDHDMLFVEGQGSINHPAYSGVTCGILHGAMPDKLVLCHAVGRETIHGFETPIPAVDSLATVYEDLAGTVHDAAVVAGALNTKELVDDDAARRAVDEYAETLDVPATDPIRFGTDDLDEVFS
ncbi:MAG: DUF1611 domain-containing protein [Halobacteriota archaeon]